MLPITTIVRTDGTLNPNAQLLWADDLDWTKDLMRTQDQDKIMLLIIVVVMINLIISAPLDSLTKEGLSSVQIWKRFTGRINVNTQPLKWFKTGLNVSAAVNTSNHC